MKLLITLKKSQKGFSDSCCDNCFLDQFDVLGCKRFCGGVDDTIIEVEDLIVLNSDLLFDIAHEAHLRGRIYNRMGEQESSKEVVESLNSMIGAKIKESRKKK